MGTKFSIFVLLVHLALMSPYVLGDVCVDKSTFRFASKNSRLEANGEAITIKGTNWWGMETQEKVPGGLNVRSIDSMLDFLVQNKFNGIRIPFSLDLALNPNNRYPNNVNYGVNPNLQGKTSIQVLDAIFTGAAARGILILLDLHKHAPNEPANPVLWYTDPSVGCITNEEGICKAYTLEDNYAAWDFLVGRYQSYWNFWGVDLLNEPHSWARWGNGNPNSDWVIGAGLIGNHIISNFPNWKGMILVEGVEANPHCEILGFPGCESCGEDGHWWGGNLEGVRCTLVPLSDQDRLVYSPHVYGVSVFNQAYFSNASFPDNLEYIYDTHFGFVSGQTGRAVVIGEWGGFYEGKDKIIQDYQAAYFNRRSINSNFYWALNPNPGGDTDGLLNADWSTPNTAKVNFLANAFPTRTVFSTSGNQICFTSSGSQPATQAPTQPPATQAPTQPPATQAPTQPATQPPTPTQPPSAGCTGTVTVTLRSGSFTTNGAVYYTYDVAVKNTGTSPITAASAVISHPGFVSQSWNYDFTSKAFSGFSANIGVSQTYYGAGFILGGGSTASVSSASFQCGSNTSPVVTAAPTNAPTPTNPPTAKPTTPATTAPTTPPTTKPTTPPTTSPNCAASVSANARSGGSSTSQIWDLVITNTGGDKITSLSVSITPASSSSVSQIWNMVKGSGNTYSVSFYGSLNNKGNSFTGAGFEIAGGAAAPALTVSPVCPPQ